MHVCSYIEVSFSAERRVYMKKIGLFSMFFLIVLSFTLLFPAKNTLAKGTIYHIPIENEVEKGLKAFLERAFKEAKENKAEAIILEIHTPGGYVNAAEEISKLMDSVNIDLIAFINSKAHSAGAFLALHADKIYMTPDASIGAAAIIDGNGNMANKKATSAWIAQMKAAAESSGRNPKYAIGMADPSVDLSELRAPVGKILTLSASEALQVGYSEGTVKNFKELLTKLGFQDSKVVDIHPTLAEKIARFITNPLVVTLLLTIAFLGIAIELFSPGFGIPGILGIIAFSLFFFGHFVAGFAGYETILLFVVGLILLLLEFFVPGGIVGLIGGAIMVIALLFSGESVTYMAYSLLIAMFISILGMVVLVKFFGKNLHVFSKIVLKDATTSEEGYVSNVNRIDLLGKRGKTVTPLRPSGTVYIDKERLDVVSEGNYIDANVLVEVVQVEGSRIVVRQVKEEMEEK